MSVRKKKQVMRSNGTKVKKGEIEIYIQGANLVIYEHHSKGSIENLVQYTEREYGIVFNKKCHSMCG